MAQRHGSATTTAEAGSGTAARQRHNRHRLHTYHPGTIYLSHAAEADRWLCLSQGVKRPLLHNITFDLYLVELHRGEVLSSTSSPNSEKYVTVGLWKSSG